MVGTNGPRGPEKQGPTRRTNKEVFRAAALPSYPTSTERSGLALNTRTFRHGSLHHVVNGLPCDRCMGSVVIHQWVHSHLQRSLTKSPLVLHTLRCLLLVSEHLKFQM
jgi:hypothetical protein